MSSDTESGYDEAGDTKIVAAQLSTDYAQLGISPEDALDAIPSLPSIYCEPFGENSPIRKPLASESAREHVPVALDSDARGDLIGGYDRYLVPH